MSSSTASVSPPPVLSNSDRSGEILRKKPPEEASAHAVPPNDENDSSRDPLPPDLRRILVEVAHSGQCSWLSWNTSSAPQESSISETGVSSTTALWRNNSKNTSRQLLAHGGRKNAATTLSSSSLHAVPPRKKRRNGQYSMRRKRHFDNTKNTNAGSSSRKRPLILIRTTSSSANNSVAGSVGSSGRTSGSEPDDSTQYECDSEGTSATTNSEVSFGGREQQLRNNIAIQNNNASSIHNSADRLGTLRFKSLREALKVALALVLDHSYKHRGGYKLSPAELRRLATAVGHEHAVQAEQQQQQRSQSENPDANKSNSTKDDSNKISISLEAAAFHQRRRRLLSLWGDGDTGGKDGPPLKKAYRKGSDLLGDESDAGGNVMDGPPFTIQRVAEVLVSPERYYKQTHKLCNCLEKLLLVTSSSSAFGGSHGGDTSQSKREAKELAALANEKGREKRLRRLPSSASEDNALDASGSPEICSTRHGGASPTEMNSGDDAKKGPLSPEKSKSHTVGDSDLGHSGHSTNHGPLPGSREYLEAAARASLRSKFDHVAIDAHAASASVERESGGRPSSPPPPTQNLALQAHGGHAGFVRQHLQEHTATGESFNDHMAHNHHLLARPPSPIMFSSSDSATPTGVATPTTVNPLSPKSSMHLLQMHHSAALATLSGTPLDLVIDPSASGHPPSAATLAAAALLDADPGRSSASNSDVDSESDDFSLDDSASDRSDGSDSGSGTAHHEPFTAARVMALNRMQQQQQRLQRGVLTALGGSSYNQEGFRPPADSEYQSGDSIDSMMAEDSGGSDSSSSDLAD